MHKPKPNNQNSTALRNNNLRKRGKEGSENERNYRDHSQSDIISQRRLVSSGSKQPATSIPLGSEYESKLRNSTGGGQPMEESLKNEMAHRFGQTGDKSRSMDFDKVRIHTGSESSKMNEEIGARAFTYGNDIYFNQGQYHPNDPNGKQLLAHELTHSVQQKGGEKKVQRHMQSNYPWEGVVAGAWSASLRGQPAHTDFKANIPKGTRLTVIGNSGNWLNVRVLVDGKQELGYISQELVSLASSDNVTAEMNSLVGEESTWVPSGPESGNTFDVWASAPTEQAAPDVTAITTINCWEMVLLAAYRTGAIDWNFIHNLYIQNDTMAWHNDLPGILTSGSIQSYDVHTKKPALGEGDIVFFDGNGHVALATGKSDMVLTFWPPPDKRSIRRTVDEVKVRSVKSLYDYMKNSPSFGTPNVTFGKSKW